MQNLFELLEKAFREKPKKIAIITEKRTYTYEDYYRNSLLLTSYIIRNFPNINQPVLIEVNDSEYELFAFMASLALGLVYIPFSSDLSSEKLDRIKSKTGAKIVLNEEKIKKFLLEEEEEFYRGSENLDEFLENLASIRETQSPVNPALAIMTSGTTGEPKLCLKSHISIVKMCEVFDETFKFSSDDVFASFTSFAFDASLKAVYLSLYKGAGLVIIKREYFLNAKIIFDLLAENDVNIVFTSVFAMRLLARLDVFSYRSLPALKRLMFSGEKIDALTLSYWIKNARAEFINLYAPTEYSFNVSYHVIKPLENYDNIPIGRAFKEAKILILDEHFNELSSGELGEIFISGAGLSLGYLGDEKLSEEKFISLDSSSGKDVYYRTGDFGYKDEYGFYYIKGRLDNQIKYHGYRIELEEIDSVINSVEGIDEAMTLYDKERELIIAAVKTDLSEAEVRENLRKVLPKYKQPRFIIKVGELARTLNGKVDREEMFRLVIKHYK